MLGAAGTPYTIRAFSNNQTLITKVHLMAAVSAFATQPDSAIMMIRVLYSLVPAVALVIIRLCA